MVLNSQNGTLYGSVHGVINPPAWIQQVEFTGTCTPHACSFFDTEIINLIFEDGMVVGNSSTLVCHRLSQSDAGVLQCYFHKEDLCVTGMLQMADSQDQISGSGSGFDPTATLLNYLLSNSSYMETYHLKSGVVCSESASNAEHTIECETVLLLSMVYY